MGPLKYLVFIATLFISSCDVNDLTIKVNSNSTFSAGLITKTTIDKMQKLTCVKSSSGKCHIVYFTEDCKTVKPNFETSVNTCTTKIIQKFSLSVSESRKFTKPVDKVKECVDYKSLPEIPSCFKKSK